MPDDKKLEPQNKAEDVEELFLIRLRYKEGRLVKVGGNTPFLLDDINNAWVVFTGKVDVFSVRQQAGEVTGTRTYLFSVEAGQALFGLDLTDSELGVLAVGVGETELIRVKLNRLKALAQEADFTERIAALLNDWVASLSVSIVGRIPPKMYEPLDLTEELSLDESVVAFPTKGVVWIKHLAGDSHFMGQSDLPPIGADGFLPISSATWLQTINQSKLLVVDTLAFMAQDDDWAGLANFHSLVLKVIALHMAQAEVVERDRLERRGQANRAQMSGALAQFASILEPEAEALVAEVQDDPLFEACHAVGQAIGITIRPHPDALKGRPQKDPLGNIARASKIRLRRVALRGEWWKRDNGPMLAYLEEDNQPVALLPTSARSYELHNPAAQDRQPVTPEVADTLDPFAYMFYRPLPDHALTRKDLIRFGMQGVQAEFALIGLIGLLVGLLGLVTPKLTELLFDTVIPGADRSQLFQLSLGLVAVAVGKTLFELTRGLALLRVEGKMDGSVQAAVWDRLLRLPVSFFRGYSAGDLADRANGISAIRQVLTGAAVETILSGVFSLFNFFLLFWYDWRLALVAVGLTLAAIGVLGLASYFQVRHQRKLVEIRGKISGLVLQFITAVSKFRVAGAESRAFSVWAREFAEQRGLAYRTERVSNYLTTFNASYPVVTSMAIFTMLIFLMGKAEGGEPTLTIGKFLGFNSAFGQFLSAALQLTGTAITILNIVPIYERTKPILEALPEVSEAKVDPDELTGDIEVSHVSFRYTPDGPLVLDDFSLHIKPREFVALVGPSGTGKSTLFRLILGFETPENGSVYYDGQDLETLDVLAVRRQIGTVLQNGQLTSGDMFTNIVGSSPLSVDDAWEAARMAGLDEDIKQMPMGMHTVISEGAGTLSGGQKQRLLIARSIVNRPRILLFDEATSALDNRTQAIVGQSLERLQATRIVIAHRLSTIINADRIFVFQDGKVAQEGTYQELINRPGLFAELAKRQLA